MIIAPIIAQDNILHVNNETIDSAKIVSPTGRFFVSQLDSLVSKYDTLKLDNELNENGRTNPVFARMFMKPTLYKSVFGKKYYKDITFDEVASGNRQIDADAKRSMIIDGMLLDLYKNNPSRVWATEGEIKKEVSTKFHWNM